MSNVFAVKFNRDIFKKKIISFYTKNLRKIIIFTTSTAILFLLCFILNYHKNQRIKQYNGKLFEILSLEDSTLRIGLLKGLFTDNSTPQITRNFAALKLVQEYATMTNYKEIKNINEYLYKQKKDIYVKYLAGLNMLILENKEMDTKNSDKIDALLVELKTKKNPFFTMVLEQEIIFLMRQNKKDEVLKKISELKIKKNLDANLLRRIDEYLSVLQ